MPIQGTLKKLHKIDNTDRHAYATLCILAGKWAPAPMNAYYIFLVLHSCLRWLVLASLILALYRSYTGWHKRKAFTRFDNTVRHTTATIAHIQLVAGIYLYFTSPIVSYFLDNFRTAIHNRQVRFFGMEHICVMVVAITVLTIGSAKAKRRATDTSKHKTVAIWYTIALLLILSSIPWAFSPLVSRPWVRWF